MLVCESHHELRAALVGFPAPIGLVPTMGFLHEGHLSLVRRARAECERVVVSIFVNPTQFGPTEDLASYPRDLPRDLEALRSQGVDLVWTPSECQVYPQGFQTWVTVEELSQALEGAHRPGHFRGVATVVAKLFNAVQPDRAYFGQKDAQQALLIRRMVVDLNFPVQISICPTVREPDGLAMSSRNTYLNPEERQAAAVIFRALQNAVDAFQRGEKDAEALRGILRETLAREPLARVQYLSVADPSSLNECSGSIDRALISLAVFLGKTRLIDNAVLGKVDELA